MFRELEYLMKDFLGILLAPCILVLLLLNQGCWNYKEISDMAILAGCAVDYDKETKKMILTTEIVAHEAIGGGETEVTAEEVQSEGNAFFDASRNIISKLGKKLLWSHAKVLIIGEDMFDDEQMLIGVLDWFKRDSESRGDIWILLSSNETAGEILMDSDFELQKITSFYLDDLLNNEKSISKYYAMPLWKFLNELSSEGMSPTLPVLKLSHEKEQEHDSGEKSNHTLRTPTIVGEAVFRGTKIAGYLDGAESRSLLIMKNALKGGVIVINAAGKNSIEPVKVTLEVFKSKTKITPQFYNDFITMNTEVEMEVNIAEIEGQENFIDEEGRIILKKAAEQQVKQQLEYVVKKLQMDINSDAIGYGNIIERENQKKWKEIKDSWDKLFSETVSDINVVIKIRGSALRSDPITSK